MHWLLWASVIVVASFGNHFVYKLMSTQASPLFMAAVATLSSGIFCLLAYFMFDFSSGDKMKLSVVPALAAVGLMLAIIEIGYLYAYNAGAPLNSLYVLVGASIAVSLFVAGVLFFQEQLTISKAAGCGLSVAAIYLLVRK